MLPARAEGVDACVTRSKQPRGVTTIARRRASAIFREPEHAHLDRDRSGRGSHTRYDHDPH